MGVCHRSDFYTTLKIAEALTKVEALKNAYLLKERKILIEFNYFTNYGFDP